MKLAEGSSDAEACARGPPDDGSGGSDGASRSEKDGDTQPLRLSSARISRRMVPSGTRAPALMMFSASIPVPNGVSASINPDMQATQG